MEFKFDELTKFGLRHLNTTKCNKGFKNGCEKYFQKKPDMATTKFYHDRKSSIITLEVNIESIDFRHYPHCDNSKEKLDALWERIEKELEKELEEAFEGKIVHIRRNSCSEKSKTIIIDFVTRKESNEEWNKDEIIEEKMRLFRQGFKFTGDLSIYTIFKRRSRRNTLSLDFQLNAFSEEMAACFDNIDEDKFKDCLQEEMSRLNKENVTITGINE